jgi:hypothetical protein
MGDGTLAMPEYVRRGAGSNRGFVMAITGAFSAFSLPQAEPGAPKH